MAEYPEGKKDRIGDILRHAIRLMKLPADFDTLYALAITCLEENAQDEAAIFLDAALLVSDSHTSALVNRGYLHQASGHLVEARRCYETALLHDPLLADAHNNLGHLDMEEGALVSATAHFRRAIAYNPTHHNAYNNLGTTLARMDQFDEAERCFEQAILIQPCFVECYANLGKLLVKAGQPDAGIDAYNLGLAIEPDNVASHVGLGEAHLKMMRHHVALGHFEAACRLAPSHVGIRNSLALLLLLLGQFERGWPAYEWRWRDDEFRSNNWRPTVGLRWLGNTDLTGFSILLYCEQGYGDTIQFCRYASHVAARGARVILAVPPALGRLLARLPGVGTVIETGTVLPPFDFHQSLLSLPWAFRTSVATIPSRQGYLTADPVIASIWREKLKDCPRPRIGIAWAGSPTHNNDAVRSIGLAILMPLLSLTGYNFHCLQNEISETDREILQHTTVTLHDTALQDFADTAALMSQLDMVICVDTSVAHLAGALGMPVWILLSHVTDWRWLLDRMDSPWYPSARLFRQKFGETWADVIGRIIQEFTKYRSEL